MSHQPPDFATGALPHVTQPSDTAPMDDRRRISPVVGLTLLEVLRHQDLPVEVLESEDPSRTMPRRLGLSDVVERRIGVYRRDVRKGRRHTYGELHDLVRLVIRRPDSEELFFRAGRILATRARSERPRRNTWARLLPRAVAFALARRRVRGRLRKLFGHRVGEFGSGPFTFEARSHLFIASDPGGDACYFATGLSEAVVQSFVGDDSRVVHVQCQARKDALCRWTVLAEERATESEAVHDFRLQAEPGTG